MNGAIFLSAGVPDPLRGADFARTADSIAISAAVSASVHVTLGRRQLIWGGHPAITPMIFVVADEFRISYGHWVKLYQSEFFRDEFPEDNKRFSNVTFTENIAQDRSLSLRHMRERMFRQPRFDAAVFIGGMEGVLEEHELFRLSQPQAVVLPVASTGGAALVLANRTKQLPQDLVDDMDYVALFHRHLGISERERRYPSPDVQPEDIDSRFWSPENRD